jgi:guanylate kinase
VTAEPLLFVISGPSGVGKDTILKKLRAHDSSSRHFVVTVKSRKPRPGEQDGVDYFFVTDQEFAERLAQDDFLETAEVYGQWSGTPRSQVVDALAAGKDVILKVDVQGTRSVRGKMPRAVTIFVEPESLEALHEQLVSRKTENDEELARRWAAVQQEMKARSEFTYRVQNPFGNPDKAVDDIERIIELAHQEQAVRPIRS